MKEKNVLYVQKSRGKKVQEIGVDAYRAMNAAKQREYRAKQKQNKAMNEAIIKIQNAVRNKRAIKEFATRYVDKYYREPHIVFTVLSQLYALICEDETKSVL